MTSDLDRPPAATLRGLNKTYRRGQRAVTAMADVSLEIRVGDFIVLLGPSGCGKTTMLRCIAGLESPDSGEISLFGKPVFSSAQRIQVPPERRGISMMFQSYALWPHMTVFNNVAYPLQSRRVARDVISQRVSRSLERTGILELETQHPGRLSGGQQQRVALARALVTEDALLLFDEPLSNVDARVRQDLRFELAEMHQELKFTAIYVTHDQEEAMELADRIVVMRDGRIEQAASPQELYSAPASRYVANFMGGTNELAGIVESIGALGISVSTPIGNVRIDREVSDLSAGDEVRVVFWPKDCAVSLDEPLASNAWKGRLKSQRYLGATTDYLVSVQGVQLRCRQEALDNRKDIEDVWFSVGPERLFLYGVAPAQAPDIVNAVTRVL